MHPARDWHKSSAKSERIQKRLADVERNGGLKNLQLLPRDPHECRRRGLPVDLDENILNVDLVCDLVGVVLAEMFWRRRRGHSRC